MKETRSVTRKRRALALAEHAEDCLDLIDIETTIVRSYPEQKMEETPRRNEPNAEVSKRSGRKRRRLAENKAPIESDEASHQVLLCPTLVRIILGYLDTKNLIRCRQVQKEVWKVQAEDLLDKQGGPNPDIPGVSQDIDPEIGYVQIEDQAKWLKIHVRNATWFKSTEKIEEFMTDMEDCYENPFPTRTVVFCLTSKTFGEPTATAALNRLLLIFGDEIWYCYAAIGDFTPDTAANRRFLIEKLVDLRNLKFLNVYNPGRGFLCPPRHLSRVRTMQTRRKGDRMGLKNLETLQLYRSHGMNRLNDIMKYAELATQVQVLHLDALGFHNLNPFKFPCLKKLFLHDYAEHFVKIDEGLQLYSFNMLEQIDITLKHNFNEYLIEDIIKMLRFAECTLPPKIRRFSIHMHVLDTWDSFQICKMDREPHLAKIVDLNDIIYPQLKELSFSYAMIESGPVILELCSKKFPQWETLDLENIYRSHAWCQCGPNSDPSLFFLEICQHLWRFLPKSVTTITVDGGSIMRATRPQLGEK